MLVSVLALLLEDASAVAVARVAIPDAAVPSVMRGSGKG